MDSLYFTYIVHRSQILRQQTAYYEYGADDVRLIVAAAAVDALVQLP